MNDVLTKVFVGDGVTGTFMSYVVKVVAMHKAGWNEWFSHQGFCRGWGYRGIYVGCSKCIDNAHSRMD